MSHAPFIGPSIAMPPGRRGSRPSRSLHVDAWILSRATDRINWQRSSLASQAGGGSALVENLWELSEGLLKSGRKTLGEVRAKLEAALGAGPSGGGRVAESLRRFLAGGGDSPNRATRWAGAIQPSP